MEKFKSLADAVALAKFAHRNQLDKAGNAYVDHPLRVLEKVKAQGAPPYVQIAAILHDVPEDTAISHDMLLAMGFSEAVVEITKLLDRGYSEWFHFVNPDGPMHTRAGTKEQINFFYYDSIKKNPGAKIVKLADIEDNTAPWRLSYLSEETRERLLKKYAYAREVLS
jgi:(p)ppGpp synthase/HD superfamily hydrolase